MSKQIKKTILPQLYAPFFSFLPFFFNRASLKVSQLHGMWQKRIKTEQRIDMETLLHVSSW